MAERWKSGNVTFTWRGRELNEKVTRYGSMAIESAVIKTWSHAKTKHTFKNRTGELERSIRIKKETHIRKGITGYEVLAGVGRSSGIRQLEGRGVGAGGSDVAYYAVYVELGTRKMAARPFMRPAFNYGARGLRTTIARLFRKL